MRTPVAALLGAVMAFSFSGVALAAQKGEKVDIGKREYQENCATCHGMSGKGDGPVAGFLTKAATDLTTLARNNKGVFPIARIYEVIEGTQDVKAHGPRDMPVWGTEYQIRAAEYHRDVDYDPQAFVRARILALVDYIYRLQVK